MGIRVYLSIDRNLLAQKKGINPRKWALVDAYANTSHEDEDAAYGAYKQCADDDGAHFLLKFKFDGLGRITKEAYEYASKHGLHSDKSGCTGGTRDIVHITALIALQDPDFLDIREHVTEVYWW